VSVSLKAVSGVESVNVSLEKGLASVKMKPGNNTTLKQIQDAVTRNGFTMKQSNATIAGTLVLSNGNVQMKISGSNDVLDLKPESQRVASSGLVNGEPVVVNGTVAEPSKGRSPDSMSYRAVVEDKQK
jgi:hypothetical protein